MNIEGTYTNKLVGTDSNPGVDTPTPTLKPKKVFIKDFVRKWIEEKRKNPRQIKLLSDIHYDLVRPLAEAGFDINELPPKAKKRRRETIAIRYPKEICDELGITRASIGLYTGDAAHMYFRGHKYSINISEIPRLQHKGTDIIIIEKEGIAERLRNYAAKSGIALVHTRGFLTEYASDLSILAQNNGGHIYTLTDFDVSGLVIAHKAEGVPRIGIDLDTLDDLSITDSMDRLVDYVTPDKHHLTHIKNFYPEDLDIDFDLKKKRIEINAVLNLVEGERFWDWIVEKIQNENSIRDYNRAIDMPDAYHYDPEELDDVVSMVRDSIREILSPLIEAKKQELREYEGLIEDVDREESDIEDEFSDEIAEQLPMNGLREDLKKIADKWSNGGYN